MRFEDVKRMEHVLKFLEGVGPRPYNSKVDDSLLGVTSISGLLKNHDTPADQLDVQALKKKLSMLKRNSNGNVTHDRRCL